jgi:hypothetical protein
LPFHRPGAARGLRLLEAPPASFRGGEVPHVLLWANLKPWPPKKRRQGRCREGVVQQNTKTTTLSRSQHGTNTHHLWLILEAKAFWKTLEGYANDKLSTGLAFHKATELGPSHSHASCPARLSCTHRLGQDLPSHKGWGFLCFLGFVLFGPGFELRPSHLQSRHTCSPFCSGCFGDGGVTNGFPWMASNVDPPHLSLPSS